MVKVKLVFPAFRYGNPPKATADGEARLTASQIIVESATVTSGPCRCPASKANPYRFRRDNGLPIPRVRLVKTWQLAPGEVERLKNAA